MKKKAIVTLVVLSALVVLPPAFCWRELRARWLAWRFATAPDEGRREQIAHGLGALGEPGVRWLETFAFPDDMAPLDSAALARGQVALDTLAGTVWGPPECFGGRSRVRTVRYPAPAPVSKSTVSLSTVAPTSSLLTLFPTEDIPVHLEVREPLVSTPRLVEYLSRARRLDCEGVTVALTSCAGELERSAPLVDALVRVALSAADPQAAEAAHEVLRELSGRAVGSATERFADARPPRPQR